MSNDSENSPSGIMIERCADISESASTEQASIELDAGLANNLSSGVVHVIGYMLQPDTEMDSWTQSPGSGEFTMIADLEVSPRKSTRFD